MPTAPSESLDAKAKRLASWEQRLQQTAKQQDELAAYLQRVGATLHEQAQAKCHAQAETLAKRDAAVTAREQAVTPREAAVRQQLADVHMRERAIQLATAELPRAQERLRAWEQRLQAGERTLTTAQAQHVRLQQADLDVVAQQRTAWREEAEIRDARQLATKTQLDAQRTALDKYATDLSAREVAAQALLKTAESRERTSQQEAQRQEAAFAQREQALAEREDRPTQRDMALAEALATTTAQAQRQTEEQARLDTLAKGLNKAKLDLDIKQAELDRRERLVTALIKQHGLKAELASLE